MRLAVLNAKGKDPQQAFPDGAGTPEALLHPPVNFHAYAACTRGTFFQEAGAIPAEFDSVLLLLRRNMRLAHKTLEQLLAAGKKVAVSWKESGAHQVAEQLNDADGLLLFRRICEQAHGAVATTPGTEALYRGAGARRVEYIPTPYPVGAPGWDFSVPLAERAGVFIGTREWDVPSRNHLAALMEARSWTGPVTVVNCDGKRGRKKLAMFDFPNLRVQEGRLNYPDYLRLLASHRLVFQRDASAVPGQVAGDAALCGVLCVGGNGAIEREIFEPGYDIPRLLADDAYYTECAAAARARAESRISFAAVAERLSNFYATF